MICGALVTVIGLVASVICLQYAMANPCIYIEIGGLLGSLLGTRMLIPLIISFVVMLVGVGYCFVCAYKKEG